MAGYSYPEGGPPADLLVEGRGKTMVEAFANVALAMYNAITPLEGINERETFTVEVDGSDYASLLFSFLAELLYRVDVDGLIAKRIKIEIIPTDFKLSARCVGERFSATTHEAGASVKAVTYHMMRIEEENGVWTVRTVFDT
jgi:SHS2 domain-containing protein